MADRNDTPFLQLDLPLGPPEAWRDVPEFEGYQVSNLGRIKSLSRLVKQGKRFRQTEECILKPHNSFGYRRVTLRANGRSCRFMVHVLVLRTFTDSCPSGYTVNHIDGIKSNNVLSNLEWATLSENHLHAFAMGLKPVGENHPQAKLTDRQAQQIRTMSAQGATTRDLVLSFGLSRHLIRRIITRRTWRHIP